MKTVVNKTPIGVTNIANAFGIIQLPWYVIVAGIIIWSYVK
jgi:hypothetical protein